MAPIISCFQLEPNLQAIKTHKSQFEVSLDLNLTKTTINIDGQEVILTAGQRLNLKQLEKIVKKDNKCFLIEKNQIIPIQVFSEQLVG